MHNGADVQRNLPKHLKLSNNYGLGLGLCLGIGLGLGLELGLVFRFNDAQQHYGAIVPL